jgi:hypothetical protein
MKRGGPLVLPLATDLEGLLYLLLGNVFVAGTPTPRSANRQLALADRIHGASPKRRVADAQDQRRFAYRALLGPGLHDTTIALAGGVLVDRRD